MTSEKQILIFDALNLFIRSHCAYPQMSVNGYQMGGTIGFLKTMRRIIDESQPKAVYIVWEGGGSLRRRAIYKEYKMNRKPEKLNRFYGEDIPESEENKLHQIKTLLSLLKYTPLCQIYAADSEADDVIAYLCTGPFKNKNKVIISSDKDMYQLLDDTTKIYSLHKKTYINKQDVFNEFGISTTNFAIAKCLCGDSSDNIPGIKGIGFKKALKLFPILGLEQPIILQDIFNYCYSHIDSKMSKNYKLVLDSMDDIKRNWRIIQLNGNMISLEQITRIDNVINKFNPQVDKLSFVRKLIKEGINDFDTETFFYTFNAIENVVRT